MNRPLTGRTVAFLTDNDGVEHVELAHPWHALRRAGARTVLLAPSLGQVTTYHHLDRAETFDVDLAVESAQPGYYDAVVLPGGVANPDALRLLPSARRFLQGADSRGITVASICHAAWTLIDAELVSGHTLAAWPSLNSDLTNAGATWTPANTHVEGNRISARSGLDVEAFTALVHDALLPEKPQPVAASM